MKKRNLTILAILLATTTFISSGLALFTYENDNEVINNVYVDPIKENYDFSGADNVSRETFDVYFFPQPRAASISKTGDFFDFNSSINTFMNENFALNTENDDLNNLETLEDNSLLIETFKPKAAQSGRYQEGSTKRTTNGRYGEYDGFFKEGNNNNTNFIIKKLTGSLDNDVLNEIGRPQMTMRDSHNSTFIFSGWTPSRKVAIDLGYGGTGDFGLIETISSFQSIDRILLNEDGTATMLVDDDDYLKAKQEKKQGVDGSFVGDGKVFLYAIYTLGKDYNSNEILDCVEATNNTDSVYFSRYMNSQDEIDFKNGEAYVARTLRLDDINDPFNIRFSPTYIDFLGRHQWSSQPLDLNVTKVLNNMESSTDEYKLLNAPIIDRLGDYNIYLYVLSSSYNESISFKNDKTFLPSHLSDNRISDIFYIPQQTITFDYFVNLTIEMWIYVEEKVDIKVLGGNIKSLDFYHPDAQNFLSISSDGSSMVADNLMFDNINDKYYTVHEKDNQLYINTFFNRTFTVLPLTSGPGKFIPKSTVKLSNDPITSSYITLAKPQDDYILRDPSLIQLEKEGKLHFFKIDEQKVKKSVYIRLKLDIQQDGTYLLSALPIELPLFVVIYLNKSDIKYDANGFIDFNNSNDPLYICDKVAKDYIDREIANGNTSLTPLKPILIGQELNNSTNFAKLSTNPQTNKWEWNEVFTLGEILQIHKTLYDVAMDELLVFENELVLIKNRVFYINDDTK